MKIILIILSLTVLGSFSEDIIEDHEVKLARTPECMSCAEGVSKTTDCVCSSSNRLPRKYACGPACDALGYCCEDAVMCPICNSGETPSSNSNCFCANSVQPRRVKYACGPACDALGYCCDPPVKTTKHPKMICRPVDE